MWSYAEGMFRTFWSILSLIGSHHFYPLWGFGVPDTVVCILDAQIIVCGIQAWTEALKILPIKAIMLWKQQVKPESEYKEI